MRGCQGRGWLINTLPRYSRPRIGGNARNEQAATVPWLLLQSTERLISISFINPPNTPVHLYVPGSLSSSRLPDQLQCALLTACLGEHLSNCLPNQADGHREGTTHHSINTSQPQGNLKRPQAARVIPSASQAIVYNPPARPQWPGSVREDDNISNVCASSSGDRKALLVIDVQIQFRLCMRKWK